MWMLETFTEKISKFSEDWNFHRQTLKAHPAYRKLCQRILHNVLFKNSNSLNVKHDVVSIFP